MNNRTFDYTDSFQKTLDRFVLLSPASKADYERTKAKQEAKRQR